MPEELGSFIENLDNILEENYGDFKIFSGKWKFSSSKKNKLFISIAWSGWGKVSAARATTRLITKPVNKKIDLLIFTGVAGSANPFLNQWDVLIPDKLIQHDMDASPLFEKYEIPALKKKFLSPSDLWIDWAQSTIEKAILNKKISRFNKVLTGMIATGDKFISNNNTLEKLSNNLPGLYAVEMEGAAFAQVACQEKISWLVIRVISDNADDLAAQNFNQFLSEYKFESNNLLKVMIENYENAPWELSN